jgi:hypothetical protein
MNQSIRFRVIILKEANNWVAQCLEYDIAAQSKTVDGVRIAFEKTVVGQACVDMSANKNPLADIAPAPDFYHEMFKKGESLKMGFSFDLCDSYPVPTQATSDDVRVVLA